VSPQTAAFGTIAGGLLSDRWLGAPPPAREDLSTVSLRMYFTPLDRWSGGDWGLFQVREEMRKGWCWRVLDGACEHDKERRGEVVERGRGREGERACVDEMLSEY